MADEQSNQTTEEPVYQEGQEELSFYDVKGKEKFTSTKYRIEVKNGRRFAVSRAPSGIEAWRILGKATPAASK